MVLRETSGGSTPITFPHLLKENGGSSDGGSVLSLGAPPCLAELALGIHKTTLTSLEELRFLGPRDKSLFSAPHNLQGAWPALPLLCVERTGGNYY